MTVQTVGRDLEGLYIAQSGGKLGFYGATPISKATVTAVTDGSTGTANAATGIQPLTATYNSTLLINSIATLADGINRIRTALANVGLVT
jgi:hypothetical protein